jgi:hypothetical protein
MNSFRNSLFSAGNEFQRTAAPRVAEEQIALRQQVLLLTRGSGLASSLQREVVWKHPFGWITPPMKKSNLPLTRWIDESFSPPITFSKLS